MSMLQRGDRKASHFQSRQSAHASAPVAFSQCNFSVGPHQSEQGSAHFDKPLALKNIIDLDVADNQLEQNATAGFVLPGAQGAPSDRESAQLKHAGADQQLELAGANQ